MCTYLKDRSRAGVCVCLSYVYVERKNYNCGESKAKLERFQLFVLLFKNLSLIIRYICIYKYMCIYNFVANYVKIILNNKVKCFIEMLGQS